MIDDYNGILWDIEESPYFKGGNMDDGKLFNLSVSEAYRMKFELEEKLLELFRDFEAKTNMTVRCAYPIVDEDTIEDVELEVIL